MQGMQPPQLGMKTITTPGFVLEPQVAEHASEMFSVLSDLAIYEFENAPPPSEDGLRARYERERLLSMLTVFLGPTSMRELGLPLHRLPSSSPANASWSFERKLDAWILFPL